jgi:hypothetical protein
MAISPRAALCTTRALLLGAGCRADAPDCLSLLAGAAAWATGI